MLRCIKDEVGHHSPFAVQVKMLEWRMQNLDAVFCVSTVVCKDSLAQALIIHFSLVFSLFTFPSDQHSYPESCLKHNFSFFLFSVFSAVVQFPLNLQGLLLCLWGTQLQLLRAHGTGFTAGSTRGGALLEPVAPILSSCCSAMWNEIDWFSSKKELSSLVHSMVSEGQNKSIFALTYKIATHLLHSCMITAPGSNKAQQKTILQSGLSGIQSHMTKIADVKGCMWVIVMPAYIWLQWDQEQDLGELAALARLWLRVLGHAAACRSSLFLRKEWEIFLIKIKWGEKRGSFIYIHLPLCFLRSACEARLTKPQGLSYLESLGHELGSPWLRKESLQAWRGSTSCRGAVKDLGNINSYSRAAQATESSRNLLTASYLVSAWSVVARVSWFRRVALTQLV